MISAWVSGGAPAGDTTQAIAAPVYASTEEITNPDLVGRMPTFTVPNTGGDLYQAFIGIDHLFQEDRFAADRGKGMAFIKCFKQLIHFLQTFIAMKGRADKDPPGEISSPGNKTQVDRIVIL